jgi:hypothetical protein
VNQRDGDLSIKVQLALYAALILVFIAVLVIVGVCAE